MLFSCFLIKNFMVWLQKYRKLLMVSWTSLFVCFSIAFSISISISNSTKIWFTFYYTLKLCLFSTLMKQKTLFPLFPFQWIIKALFSISVQKTSSAEMKKLSSLSVGKTVSPRPGFQVEQWMGPGEQLHPSSEKIVHSKSWIKLELQVLVLIKVVTI